MIAMVNFMEESKVWKDKIVQITVGQDGSLTLVPRSGSEHFLFGSPTGIAEKFAKMELYYKGIAQGTENGQYKVVDLEVRRPDCLQAEIETAPTRPRQNRKTIWNKV